jgi:hypothetical protein
MLYFRNRYKRKVQYDFKIALPKEFVQNNDIKQGQTVWIEMMENYLKISFEE